MSYAKHLIAVIVLVLSFGRACGLLWGQDRIAPLQGAAQRLTAAERQIQSRDDYWIAREQLALQALRLAEQDLDSPEAEKVLQWVLSSPRSSPAAMQAARLLGEHHSTSKTSVDWLLNKSPREWTPELFDRFQKAELPDESRVIVELSKALHDRELLGYADEIKASDGATTEYEARLGKALVDDLRKLDGDKFASELIVSFEQLSNQHGRRVIGGAKVSDLAEGAIFAIKHLRLGAVATGLAGTSPSEQAVDLKQYRGSVVLVDFWATWCAPCVGELPKLKQLKSSRSNQKFEIIGVSVDDDREVVKKFVKEKSVSWPTIADTNGKLQKRWLALSLPTYYVLDQDHVVRYRGPDLVQATRIVESLLGQDEIAQMVRLTLEALDKNNNQRLEKGELPDSKQAIIAAADIDKDGVLSVDELTSYFKANITSTKTNPNPGNNR